LRRDWFARIFPTDMTARSAALAAVALLAAGCAAPLERGWSSGTDRLTSAADRLRPGWGGPRVVPPDASLTVARVRGGAPEAAPLLPEPGDVWPAPEAASRATLANPDEALRGVPAFREGEPQPQTAARRGSSSPPPPPLPALTTPDEPPQLRQARPARLPRLEDPVIDTPSGPVPVTGRAGTVRGTQTPQGSGIAIDQGSTTTLFGPGGRIEVVPNRPR